MHELFSPVRSLYDEYMARVRSRSRRLYGQIDSRVRQSVPVMNLGTYLRTVAIDVALLQFIERAGPDTPVQVVNLGSGSDLRMVQYLSVFPQIVKFLDVDFEEAVAFKGQVIDTTTQLKQIVEQYTREGRYELLSIDLCDVQHAMELLTTHTRTDVATVFITECLLCYIPQRESQLLIDSIQGAYSTGTPGGNLWVSYDPIGGSAPNDRFGKIIERKLAHVQEPRLAHSARLQLKGDVRSSVAKAIDHCNVVIRDMWQFLQEKVTDEEKKRVAALQFLDELEELKVMQTHYVILSAQW
ncbi:leucine carboxy methyltransferase KNAG_0C03120 [Huiozyma naganishii CBS 8797]|uniref:Leucine carboxyl methyltransferase 1 n=1 Tax=Huiozyma naganishii (strain ATCC MYA-139 / BCRC 22969 / CBS 8797 / KCTC 17520 / NBRC 10181 / NCYC 3082 / Yp74L-3) TaxID=1071383 RepID=J7RIS1_HUIN7|nr:hypothetical protein KNAG_0C03120 [Kazachstania naganishii CBS 8797]CCK69423.1 hypothetical protein KNAG_0C03120 [Kazachstania naganishii CBS 8797]